MSDENRTMTDQTTQPLCPLCQRPLVPGPSVEHHHIVPKSKGGRETVALHAVCHKMLHKVFTETELAHQTPDFSQALAHPEIAKFVSWVQKKPLKFKDLPRTKGRRPYHRSR